MQRLAFVFLLVFLPSFTFSLPPEGFGPAKTGPETELKKRATVDGKMPDRKALEELRRAFNLPEPLFPGGKPLDADVIKIVFPAPSSPPQLRPFDPKVSKPGESLRRPHPSDFLNKGLEGTGKIRFADPPGTHGIGWSYLDRSLANDRLLRLNRENPDIQVVRIRLQPEYFAERYVVDNGEPGHTYVGNDLGELIQRLCEPLDHGKNSVVVELEDFTEKDKRAFTTGLSVQQELFDPRDSWTPISNTTPEQLSRYQQPGMKLERATIAKETAEGEHQGWFRVVMEFASGNAESTRGLGVQLWFRILNQARDFVHASLRQLTLNHTGTGLSPAELVDRSKKQLLAHHPELSDQQIGTEIRDEFRHTKIGELLISKGTAA